MSRGRAKFTDSDLTRIFRVAAKAGVDVRVEIRPDGTLVVTGKREGNAADRNEWDEALDDDQDKTAIRSRV